MSSRTFKVRSAPEQLADYLSEEIRAGRMQGPLPGVHRLSSEFGIHRTTAETTMRLLEQDGLIQSQGPGKRRKIVASENLPAKSLRVALLLRGPDDVKSYLIGELRHLLRQAGHEVVMPAKSLSQLRFKTDRLARLVAETPADGWVVLAGSRGVLEWFSKQSIPTFALFGALGSLGLAHAGPVKGPAISKLVERLVELGHRRISLLVTEELRKPRPVRVVQHFLSELQSHGIPAGSYNLPDWSHGPEGLWQCLESLFEVSRPSALIVDESDFVPLVMQFLATKGLLIPDDVSLACLDGDSWFKWTRPTMTHLTTSRLPWIRRVLAWAGNQAVGVDDRRKTLNKATFVEGGTIGPVSIGMKKG